MNSFPRFLLALVACCFAPSFSSAAPAPKKVLFFTKSSGFEHSTIKRLNGNPSFADQVLTELGAKHGFVFTFSKDGSLFTPEYLAQFDAFFFYTSGDLTLAKNDEKAGDGNPPMTPAGKAAFLKAIYDGKGFVGTHSASDTFHPPGNKGHGPARNRDDGANIDDYTRMIGASFIKHDAQQKARQIIVSPKFPRMAAVPADFGPLEEWYSLKNFAPDLHVLMVQDTRGMEGPSYARPPFPSTWARMHGQGRVFYTSMGHREDVWTSPVFQAVLLGGLEWATRRVDADVTPNLADVAPRAGVLPVYVAPPPPKAKAETKAEPKKS